MSRSLSGNCRQGTSLVEALVALLLTALILHLSWSVTVSAQHTASTLMERSEALDTERLTWHVLADELSAGLPERDFWVERGRIVHLRAFRGLGDVCPTLRTVDGALVRYRGVRLPDPDKDSLLILTADGSWRVAALVSRAASGSSCGGWGGTQLERWSWAPQVEDALLARVFERGSYHLEGRALRYLSSNEGGRQPLTAERLEDAGSWISGSVGQLDLHLRVRADRAVRWESRRSLVRAEEPF